MNCLDCRRRLLSAPQVRDAELNRHIRECAGCARLVAQQTGFEQQLGAAMRVPVPENLSERVRFAASMRQHRPWRRLAAAAAVGILAIGLSLGGWEYRTSAQISEQITQRLQDKTDTALTKPRLAQFGDRLGAFLESADMGAIVSARERTVRGQSAAQFDIVNGDQSASVFMLPNTWLAATHDVEANGIPGKLIPFEGGVIGVFCPDRAMLRRFAARLHTALRLPG